MKDKDLFRERTEGCLLGGAVGDALGYAVEFLPYIIITQEYGKTGITDFDLCEGAAQVSDDTQMTLFTASGLLRWLAAAHTGNARNGPVNYVYDAYHDWYTLQSSGNCNDVNSDSWLCRDAVMAANRSPGNTCMGALESGLKGCIATPINNSCGCGGVMRVSPVALMSPSGFIDDAPMLAAEASALTHGNPLGFIPSYMLCVLIQGILSAHEPDLLSLAQSALKQTMLTFNSFDGIESFGSLIFDAIALSSSSLNDQKAICKLGAGWVAHETLAIALYSALRYPSDFRQAMICAVNHDGDSDSTGAVAGNILGAALGKLAVAEAFDISKLDAYDAIMRISNDITAACIGNTNWFARYA